MTENLNLRIVALERPDSEQAGEIRRLARQWNENDGTHYSWFDSSDFLKEGETGTFLALKDNRTIAWIQVFSFGDSEGELIVQVAPEHRRQGVFSTLLNTAREELRKRNIRTMLLTCDAASDDAILLSGHLGATYHISEFLMRHDGRTFPVEGPGDTGEVRLIPAEAEHRDILAAIGNEGFADEPGDFGDVVDSGFKGDMRTVYRIEQDGEIVGVIMVSDEDAELYIHGFVISAEYRGRGIGGRALAATVEILRKESPGKPVVLEVETGNARALDLYRRVGFRMITEFRYYRLDVG